MFAITSMIYVSLIVFLFTPSRQLHVQSRRGDVRVCLELTVKASKRRQLNLLLTLTVFRTLFWCLRCWV